MLSARVPAAAAAAALPRHTGATRRPLHASARVGSELSSFHMLTGTQQGSGPKRFRGVELDGFQLGDTRYRGPLFLVHDLALLWHVPQWGLGGPSGESAKPGLGDKHAKGKGGEEEESTEASPFDGWTEDAFTLLASCEERPDILVIGTGARMFRLPPALRAHLHALGVQVEVSDSVSGRWAWVGLGLG
jgi:uncharacterized protein